MPGRLPKIYLRLDPNIDHTHPEPEVMVRLMCAANRQPVRGRFKSRAVIEAVIGRPAAKRAIERADVVRLEDGRWYLDGWDHWQEGDMEVAERVRRLRERRGVTEPLPPPLPERYSDVSEALPTPLPTPFHLPLPPSETLDVRRKTLDVASTSSAGSTHISRPLAAIAARLRAEGGG